MDWKAIGDRVLNGGKITKEEALAVLESSNDELLEIAQAAFRIRKKHFGKTVSIHLLQNVKSGICPEDCTFCSQSSKYKNDVERYSMQTVETIVEGAQAAVDRNAKRYCMVASSRAPSPKELEVVCEATRQIKQKYPNLEICSSLGLLTEEKAKQLKEAGVNRFNHNLETSENFFPEVVTTHDFEERIHTAKTAKKVGLDLCCGGLYGMGESLQDRVDLAFALADLDVDSVPVNFLDPRPGTPFSGKPNPLTPNDCIRALCMMRFVCPTAEIRAAGGREKTLRGLQSLALYPANSIFTAGYLTTGGAEYEQDKQMIEDAGFEIEIQGAKEPALA
ncbi:biotin synthase BioB [Pontiella agarivorans]|uniref:Biotin synthase n=1 Tax=Pontiella agarivorans TaxID=3038953 RepID=A0ABU5MZI7_9BACT|nr:biotin synthase BioB [Pontiella agarivorans]MDZ8119569.1 biotin synthase BioB [Pontiella agarivorans]